MKMKNGNKYGAKKIKDPASGYVFDSKAEFIRWCELRIMERGGNISGLKRQVKYELIPKQPGERACNYIADFTYIENGELVVEDVKGMKIGIPRDYFGEGLDPEVKAGVLAAAKALEEKGAIVEEFDLSLVEYAIPAYYTIAAAEASSNLERFDGIKYGYRAESFEGLHNMYKRTRSEGFGPEVKRRIMLGSFVLSSGYYDAYYIKAMKVRALIKKTFDEATVEKINLMLAKVDTAYEVMIANLTAAHEGRLTTIKNAYDAEEQINVLRNELREAEIEALEDNQKNYQTSVYYIDIINELEHMGDYMINISQSLERAFVGK